MASKTLKTIYREMCLIEKQLLADWHQYWIVMGQAGACLSTISFQDFKAQHQLFPRYDALDKRHISLIQLESKERCVPSHDIIREMIRG